MQTPIIITNPENIKQILLNALKEYEKHKAEQTSQTKLLSINKVAKILGVSHATVKNLVENETIKATPDNKITEKELNNYLENKNNS